MKKQFLSSFFALTMLVLMGTMFFVACNDDDDNPPIVVLDGYYIKGAGTALTDLADNGRMTVARNEVNQTDRADLFEMYIAVKAGTDGFNIVMVKGDTLKTYGPGADFAKVPTDSLNTDEPKNGLWRGSMIETTNKFTVEADGLYHVAFDRELMIVVIAKVDWGIIGAATPGGWSTSSDLTSQGFDLNTMTFQVTDLVMTKADFKFRYSNGWKIILDANYDLGGGSTGIKVNTNFGGQNQSETSLDPLVPGGPNISNDTPGKYTVTMVWTLGTGHVATMTKTGDLDLVDYTSTSLGLVGDGLVATGNWDETIMLSTPTIENVTTYIWTWAGVEINNTGSFKIREGQDWNGKVIGYNEVTMSGLAADKFGTNGDGNFVPSEAGTFDFELKIDAVTETYTLAVNPAGQAPELYMLGDGCTAGWDNTIALPMTGTAGEYTITTTLSAGKWIKFITTLGAWAPMYGTDAAGTSESGNLVYRATESDPDPNSIPTPATDGTYTVSVNTNTLTYTITAK